MFIGVPMPFPRVPALMPFRVSAPRMLRRVDIAAHLDLALELADRADEITLARFRADDLWSRPSPI